MDSYQDIRKEQIVQNVHFSDDSIELYSPRKVARSIGVSESSLKRWCDAGILNATKTAGGHRRISRPEVISFVKRRNLKLFAPETLGLPVLEDVVIENPADALNQYHDALLVPDATKCSKLLFYVFMSGWNVAEIFDQLVSPAMTRIGDQWHEGQVEVYQERQACQACLSAIHQLSSLLPSPRASAPTALGGSIEDDYYDVPTKAVEATLVSLGWRATSLGSNLPLESLLKSAHVHRPTLFWLSVSHLEDPVRAVFALNEFASGLPVETTLVIGGHAIDSEFRSQIKQAIFCDNLSQLEALVLKLYPPKETGQTASSTNPKPVDA